MSFITDFFNLFRGGGLTYINSCDVFNSEEYINNIYENSSFTIAELKKTEAFKVIEWGVYKKKKDGKEKIENHVLNKMFQMPNSLSSWGEFSELLINWYDGKDNGVLIEKVSNGNLFTPMMRIYNPNNFNVYVSNYNIYKIEINNPSRTVLGDELENFMWIKQPNPHNSSDCSDYLNGIVQGRTKQRGIAALGSFIKNSWLWNNSIVKNSNSRNGLYATKTRLSQDDEKAFREKIESRNSLTEKGKDLVISGDVTFTPIDNIPKDIEWSGGDETAHKRISLSLGVPVELTGSGESTYNNRKEAKKELYEDKLIPFARELERRFNYFFKEFLKNGEYITFDTSSIPALQTDMTENIKNLDSIKDRVTVNEYREILSKITDISLKNLGSAGDKILVSSSSVDLEELTQEIQQQEDEV